MKLIRISLFLCILTAFILIFSSCGRNQADIASEEIVVAASIAPMASFARAVGGDVARVQMIVPPGASPHTYQLDPDQMKLLSRADILVLNGVGLEYWAKKATEAAQNPDLIVVRTAEGLDIIDSHEEHGDHGDHAHEFGNPHVWLSVPNAIHQVKAIRDAYIEADPDNKQRYTENADAYIEELKELDSDIREILSDLPNNEFIAFHSAWVYFAREYGLEQVAVVEESPGKEPSPAHIRRVIQTAEKHNVKAVFAEPQFSPKAAQVIASEAGADVLFLDPLGSPPDYDYISTMRGNIEQIAKALKQG